MKMNFKGIDVFYRDKGLGKAVVLLHGFLGNSGMWKDLMPEISKSNRVVAIDLLGHGHTGCIGYIHTMESMAECVNAVLNHLDIEESIIIGHSMGGYVALAYADLFPQKVLGLCMMNSTALPDTEERQINRDRAIIVVKQNHNMFIRMSVANLFAPHNREKLAEEIEQATNEALKTPLQGIVSALEGMKLRKNRVFILKRNTFKKMMIIGRMDPILEYDSLLEQVKDTDVEVVEFSDGHMSHIENSNDLTYKIIQFIEKYNSLT